MRTSEYLRINTPRSFKEFTEDEDEYIMDHYLFRNDQAIGEALGRSAQSIRQRRRVIGMFKHDFTKSHEYKYKKEENIPRVSDMLKEIDMLVNYIEVRKGEGMMVQLANDRRKELIKMIRRVQK